MQSGLTQAGAFDAALASVARNVQQINILVNDILFIQEMDLILPHFQRIDIKEVIQVAIQAVQDRYPAGTPVTLHKDLSPELPLVPGDAKSLERAFEAILDNAIKFSPGGGIVHIEAYREEAQVYIAIHDHGIGIPSEDLPHVFDRFFHTDQFDGYMFRGAGLGLSIARQVVEQHGGRILLTSEVGEGTKVTICLPTNAL
jgi:signal transduction histidine kinase